MERIFEDKEECCGCNACYNKCPKKCIMMEEDERGYKYPTINQEECIDCKICIKVCPLKQEFKQEEQRDIYAMKNKNQDIRSTSSSGGVFISIAEHIINQNGVVYGAAFDSDSRVTHIRCTNIESISKLKGSKYVQSDNKNMYQLVENDLKEDKKVLYSGTPCQIHGLKTFLIKEYSNLITCDVICHGVPSPKLFEEYKQLINKKNKSKIRNIDFRFKNKNGTQNMKIILENNKELVIENQKDDFYSIFLKNINIRESCFSCKYSKIERIGDITLGDFWGIERSIQGFDDNKGVSLVLFNTIIGKQIFNIIKENYEIVKTNEKDCVQQNLKSPTVKSNEYEKFWSEYEKKGFEKACKAIPKPTLVNRVKRKVKSILKI